ncbi:MAG TPA: exonuclease domain-containing protein, partial [Longimicrobiales bacterium]|nr:exonuclease domain-containing protein [Longimicrobiales bacterium]
AGFDAPTLPRLCTVRMARRLLPGLRRRNLDALTRHFGIPVHQRHRAFGDALATARILLRLLDEAGCRGIHDLDALQRFLGRRRGRGRTAQRELFDGGTSPERRA